MLTPIPDQLGLTALAHVLFASAVQPSQHPSREAVRAAVVQQLRTCQGDPAACVGLVAQEAGDHPELYATRMRWALRSVARAYPGDARPADAAAGTRPRCGGAAPYARAALPGAA
jgi:hypothetical protein